MCLALDKDYIKNKVTFDAVNSDLGHIKGNIKLCCYNCN